MQKEIPTTNTAVETTPTETVETEVAETTTEETIQEGTETTKSDPFDAIEDPELRAEAKKYRGIANRGNRKQAKDIEKPQTDSQFVTREELYADNRVKVIQDIENFSDDDPQAGYKRELNDNWQDIMTYFVDRNGQKTPEAIQKDIRAAYLVWKDTTGGAAIDDTARQLQSTTIGASNGTQQRASGAPSSDDDPRFQTNKTPDKWYPKKD